MDELLGAVELLFAEDELAAEDELVADDVVILLLFVVADEAAELGACEEAGLLVVTSELATLFSLLTLGEALVIG